MIKHVEKEKKEQIAKNKVEEINDIVNFLNEQEVNENIQENEGNLLQDMLEGEKLVQKVDNAPAFVEKVIQPDKILDEKFREMFKKLM